MSGTGNASGSRVGVSGTGDATGSPVAASGTGNATAQPAWFCVHIPHTLHWLPSGRVCFQVGLAVSGTGHASGGIAISGCDTLAAQGREEACVDPDGDGP